MKCRYGFVSNSSSTSYVVIGNSIDVTKEYDGCLYVIGENGEYKFGWDWKDYIGYDTLINFAYLQTLETKDKELAQHRYEMLERVINKYLGATQISMKITNEYMDCDADCKMETGYIDHASSACENENIEIFENDEILAKFLFGKDSMVVGRNDNSGPNDEE